MRRRKLLGVLLAPWALPAWPRGLCAQPAVRKLRVGTVSGQPRSSPLWSAFEARMAELGYRDGRTLEVDYIEAASADGFAAAYRHFAGDTLDVIVASGPEIALKSALALPGKTPIVMIAIDYDPIALGYVKSLARPEGRVTGLFLQQIELAEKRLQLLKEGFPDLAAATVFWDRISADQWTATQRLGRALALKLAGVELRDPPYDYDKALADAPAECRGTLLTTASPFFFRDRARLAEFATRRRTALVSMYREMAEAGALLTYGADLPAMFARAADYVGRLARGQSPADLPVEQPTKFELVVNLRTARAIGIAIPPLLLARADHVIE